MSESPAVAGGCNFQCDSTSDVTETHPLPQVALTRGLPLPQAVLTGARPLPQAVLTAVPQRY